jgi:hypothetical protein
MTSRSRFQAEYTREGRTWSRDELLITPEQAAALSTNLRTTLVTLRGAGGYPYRNFSDNCATRIRDQIFAVVDPALRAGLEAQAADPADTYLSAVSGFMDAAAASHGGSLTMIPGAIRGTAFEPFVTAGFTELGIHTAVAGGADFMSQLHGMQASLADDNSGISAMADSMPAAADGTTARQQLTTSFANFDAEMAQTPANAYLAIYTPARLKAKLVELGLIAAPAPAEAPVTPQP